MILQQTRMDYKHYSITDLKIEPPIINVSPHVLYGCDPGTTKLGLAYLWKSVCHIFEISIIRSPDAVVRMLFTQEILDLCFKIFDYAPLMVIEGSSFGNNYRQVELAEVRASVALWAIKNGIKPSIIPPMSIRKNVFGSAKLRPETEWDLREYSNAANALACAYFSTKE